MRKSFIGLLIAGCAVIHAESGLAACPVGKKEGDTWCEKGMQYRCDRCGSEYCQIITGNKCVKDSEEYGPASRTKLRDALESNLGLNDDAMGELKNAAVRGETLSKNSHAY